MGVTGPGVVGVVADVKVGDLREPPTPMVYYSAEQVGLTAFDVVVRTARWLAFLGGRGYEFALWLNNPVNWLRRHLGLGYWSLSAYLKYRVKRAVAFIGAFEDAVAQEARRRDADGIICGHIHHAADRTFHGVHYLNCGDWVESCTAVAEHADGRFEIIAWTETDSRQHLPEPFKQVRAA